MSCGGTTDDGGSSDAAAALVLRSAPHQCDSPAGTSAKPIVDVICLNEAMEDEVRRRFDEPPWPLVPPVTPSRFVIDDDEEEEEEDDDDDDADDVAATFAAIRKSSYLRRR